MVLKLDLETVFSTQPVARGRPSEGPAAAVLTDPLLPSLQVSATFFCPMNSILKGSSLTRTM